jgi:hypothetical protein
MGFVSQARRLDNKVLGRSDSPRGFAANLLLLGLHPALTPVWAVLALLGIGSGGWMLVHGNVVAGLTPFLVGLVAAARAFASSGLPLWPGRQQRR